MATSGGRWRSQAAADAALKFNPQHTALGEALREAQNTYRQTVQAGRSTARQTQGAAQAALPQIAGIYSGADAATHAGTTLVSQALAGLPGVADQFKADQASEGAQQIANLSSARARDEALLAQQGVSARAGAQFNQTQARSALQQAVSGLLSKNSNLGAEQGAFAASEAEKLAHEAETLQQKETASIRSSTTSRENSKEAHAGGKTGYVNGVKQRTGSEQQKASGTIGSIVHLASAAFKEGHDRRQVLSILTEDEPAITESVSERDKEGKPTGRSRSQQIAPARKAFEPNVLMSAALDEAQFGGVTKHTLDRLHTAGYSIKQLGLKVVSGGSTQVQKGLGPALRSAAQSVKGF